MKLAAALLAILAIGCGKKGPPLVPYQRIPAAVDQITTRRSGNEVFVSITVPSVNVDKSVPIAISYVEVWGYTGRTIPARNRWSELGTLIATIPVAPPPDDPGVVAAGVPTGDTAPPGAVVTVIDTLTPDRLLPGPLGASSKTSSRPSGKTPADAAATPPPPQAPLRRFYAAFAWNPRGRPGPAGAIAELALSSVPDPPAGLTATYTATQLQLSWEPSGGTLGYVLARTELAPEPLPQDDDEVAPVVGAVPGADTSPMASAGPVTYNIYRVLDPDPKAPAVAPVSKWTPDAMLPINAAPLPALATTDTVQFDRRVCYTVRALRGVGPRATESVASAPWCTTPVDTFPPAAPRSLAAVAAAGAINLIWEANDEADVAGYLILRGAPGDATLQTLTPKAIPDTRYRDDSVTSGARYVYAVVAVDGRRPKPNVSAESNRVEDTAR